MPGDNSSWGTAILVAVVALIGTGYLAWQYLDSRPAHIYARVMNPSPDLTVELEDRKNRKDVNEQTGFFRFDNIGQGEHELIFRHPSFEMHTRPLVLNGGGEHRLLPDIQLPTSADANLRVGPTLYALAVQHSDDASDPLAVYAAKAPDAFTFPGVTEDGVSRGWAYIGKKDEKTTLILRAMVSKGTTTLVEPAVVRDATPNKEKFASGYKLGEPVGYLEAGEKVYINEYRQIGGTLWADVKSLKANHDDTRPES